MSHAVCCCQRRLGRQLISRSQGAAVACVCNSGACYPTDLVPEPGGERWERPIVIGPADIDLSHESSRWFTFFMKGDDVIAVFISLIVAVIGGSPGSCPIHFYHLVEIWPLERHRHLKTFSGQLYRFAFQTARGVHVQ